MTEDAGPVSSTSAEPFRRAEADVERLRRATGHDRHDAVVVLGSGWSGAAAELGHADAEVPFTDMASFPVPTVGGHAGIIRSVSVGTSQVLVMLGRAHLYEGHDASTVVHPVRVAVMAGCRAVILSNAAGGIRETFHVGDPVLISDHLNLTGHNPLLGDDPPPPHPGRFCDMTSAYSPVLRALVRDIEPGIAEGVYAGMLGPSYETPAEIRMLRTLGADLVGMSTVMETIAAVHLGAEVLGLSLVTNPAAGISGAALEHTEVLAAGSDAGPRLGRLLRQVLERLPPA